MCILTSKLCTCMHRSPPKWVFCADAIEAATTEPVPHPCQPAADTFDLSTTVHHSESTVARERCAGNVDFCCSGSCCQAALLAARRKCERTLAVAKRRDAPDGIVVAHGMAKEMTSTEAADAALERERESHALCGGKRAGYLEALKKEQPCLFV
ncbi:hypothetical protein B0A55_04861 [Friedmanniomyces simplex]|uniref:Uncharacterized protein n=1 Tax=Friedmanniomyces simplex TaxID=329884 RepID=A0A4U0XFZ8_9PEZI|nr:hypothetical protein B0A55_04861 [Friedmanniomyces simplex]